MRSDEIKTMVEETPKLACDVGIKKLTDELEAIELSISDSVSKTVIAITNIEKKVGESVNASVKGKEYAEELIAETLALRDSIIGSACLWYLDMVPSKKTKLDILEQIVEQVREEAEEDNE